MNDLEAIAAARSYLKQVFVDENITDISLEEIEHVGDQWMITFGFSRPWNTPRTRAQEVLENLGAASPVRRTEKVILLHDDGRVLSMKDRPRVGIGK